jgi:phosphoribosylaminoimidazole (AIR) synthetase
MVHITGGGFYDNIPRVLPEGFSVQVDSKAWSRPAIFELMKSLGNLTEASLFHTFNCGIGYVLMVDASQVQIVLNAWQEICAKLAFDCPAYRIGEVFSTPGWQEVTIL